MVIDVLCVKHASIDIDVLWVLVVACPSAAGSGTVRQAHKHMLKVRD
jgi:hypothetical protein